MFPFRPHAGDADDQMPEEVRELDRMLEAIRFEPRASLGPEVVGRLRREKVVPTSAAGWSPFRWSPFRMSAIALLVVGVSAIWFTTTPADVMVDRCCYDFDGGGEADDGVVAVVQPNGRIRRIAVYEDLDASGSYTSGDLLRFDRPPTLTIPEIPADDLITLRHCCSDYDGEGIDDDGVIVVAAPPDRVTMVAVYQRSTGANGASTEHGEAVHDASDRRASPQ